MITSKERHSGLDIVRVIATLFVLSVHFFGNTYYYSTPLAGKNMYIETFFRMLFVICVPLFIILTGYLQINKMPIKSYYKKLIPIYIIYIIYSLLSILYSLIFLNEKKSLLEYIFSVFNFTANGYSWYINMYIGLFLLIPFLNILYKNIPTKKLKIILICTLLFITSLPNLLNGYIGGNILFSADYWVPMYPVSYYFIGSFIKEYQIKINKPLGISVFIFLTIISMWVEVFFARGGNYVGAVGYYPSLIIVFQATIFFLLIFDLNIKNNFLSNIVTLISTLSLDIYLVSFITDKIVYGYFLEKFADFPQQKVFFFSPVLVFSTFILAFSIAFIRHKLIRIK